MNNTIAKLPDIWYDFYGRLLPGAYGVSFFQLFVLGQSIEATLENFLYIMISGYLLGHIFQPISSMIILWRERKHDPDDQKGQVNSEMGPETRAAHLLSKAHAEGAGMVSFFIFTLIIGLAQTLKIESFDSISFRSIDEFSLMRFVLLVGLLVYFLFTIEERASAVGLKSFRYLKHYRERQGSQMNASSQSMNITYEALDGREYVTPDDSAELSTLDITITGVVERGQGKAGKKSTKYPKGTLRPQYPLFKERGLDLGNCFAGTLNVSIAPKTFKIVKPSHKFESVNWRNNDPEDFLFCNCCVITPRYHVKGFVYLPDPKTKRNKNALDNPNHLQVIAPYIPGVGYGTSVEVALDSNQIQIE